jgi:hypothetical protein
MILRMRKQTSIDGTVPEIDTLILIDRQVDLVSPLLVQLTYEGLIDELYGIKYGKLLPNFEIKVNGSLVKSIPLNSEDVIFKELRDLNQSYIGLQIKNKALQVEKEIKEKDEVRSNTEKLKEFYNKKVKRLVREQDQIALHLSIAQENNKRISKRGFRKMIKTQTAIILGENEKETYEFIEELIYKQGSLLKVLRLLCLISLVQNGIPYKKFDSIRKEILQTYGYESILTLNNLEKLGMLKKNETKSNWSTICKAFDLINLDMNHEKSINDLHSLYSGIAPLSLKVIENALNGWKGSDKMDLLPGPTKEEEQVTLESQQSTKVVMVYFIGGCTMSEINGIRYLNNKQNEVEYVVCTTKLINANTFLESMIEKVGNIKSFLIQKEEMIEKVVLKNNNIKNEKSIN